MPNEVGAERLVKFSGCGLGVSGDKIVVHRSSPQLWVLYFGDVFMGLDLAEVDRGGVPSGYGVAKLEFLEDCVGPIVFKLLLEVSLECAQD